MLFGTFMSYDQTQRLPRETSTPTANGTIQGLIRNSLGLGLPSVAVGIRNVSSGQAFSSTTTGAGIFRFVNLPAGRYDLRAVLDGFRSFERAHRGDQLFGVWHDLILTVPLRRLGMKSSCARTSEDASSRRGVR
jgi:hypothetical protein